MKRGARKYSLSLYIMFLLSKTTITWSVHFLSLLGDDSPLNKKSFQQASMEDTDMNAQVRRVGH